MILAVQEIENVKLNFYGDGPDLNILKEYCNVNKFKNVIFYGRYDISEIGTIYAEADLIWAAYPNKNLNVKYAISNKFFECIAFKKIGIFSEKTKIGEFVSQNKIGLTVDPYDYEKIRVEIERFIKDNEKKYIMDGIKNFKEDVYWDSYEGEVEL